MRGGGKEDLAGSTQGEEGQARPLSKLRHPRTQAAIVQRIRRYVQISTAGSRGPHAGSAGRWRWNQFRRVRVEAIKN
jgi:hypothetical protein